MKDKIAIIGSGALATALAKVLYDAGSRNIIIYGVDKNELEDLSKGFNTKYFPKSVKLSSFETTNDFKFALKDAKYIILAIPSIVVGKIMEQVIDTLDSKALIINGSKGFYPGTKKSLHQGIKVASKRSNFIRGVVSLIGPSHAEEIVLGKPTIVASVDKNRTLCEEVQNLFSNEYFKVYVQTDVRGAEVGAAYKNVLAIASGIADGLGFGINTIAALLTRGMAEMIIFNKAMKGKRKTIMGLTGMGDMIVTATSPLSRNFTLGRNIALKGKSALKTKVPVEGLTALDNIYDIALKKKLELPIVNFLYSLVHKDCKPKNFVQDLWNRKLKSE